LQYDAHQLEFHWIGDKARKMARCKYVMPSGDGVPGSCGIAWVCVEDEFIKAKMLPPSHLGELYVLPSPVAIAAGETISYLGLVETPGSLIGGKKSKHQVHLEVFTQDPRLDDVLANKAGTKGGATYAKVPADLILHEKKSEEGKSRWVTTKDKSQEVLVESPKLEKDAAKQEWVCVSSDKYVKKEQVELLSQHDWLKIGFKKVDGSGSDGYLDPDAPPTFFTDLVKSFDTDGNGELSSEEIQAALQNSSNADQLHKLIVKHPSEWYEKSSASSYQWLDKLMTKIGLPDFDKLVDHEKQRIDKLEWMQSAAKLNLEKEVWHFSPIGIMALITERRPSGDTIDFNTTLGIYKISKKSAEFILSWEAYMPKPYVPKGDQSSGVTIGYGYDLGQQESSSARTMLSDYYTAAQVERLLTAIGKKGDNARAIVHELSDISIDKDRALDMAMRLKERYCQVVVNTYPQAINLPPDSAGAILSLVYNRGPSLKKPKIGDPIDSRREMREIGDDFSKGNIKNIPARLRSMRRLWASQRGLRDRREGEPKLIEEELARGE
jgi:GH24 family phage-related lysozyme (muramidase)